MNCKSLDSLINVIADALCCPSSEILHSSGLGKHPKWDSLGHISVMVALERDFGITIDETNVAVLISVAEIRKRLAEHE